MKGLFKKALSVVTAAALALSLTSGIPIRLPVDLGITASAANEITWPNEGDAVTIGTISYTYKGDYSTTALSVDSSAENSIYKAGDGYVLWNKANAEVTLHDASITAYSALDVPANVNIVVEGSNVLTGTSSYGLNSSSGGLEVSGSGSLTILTNTTPGAWVYSCNAGGGNIAIDITGNFISNGINAQNGSITIESDGSVDITGLIRTGSAVSINAGTNLSIANSTNFAITNIGSGNVSLTSKTGNISVNTSAANKYAISAAGSAVTLDAAGTVSVDTVSDGYAGVYGSSLALSGTIPAETTLHSTCNVTVPEGKTLTNYGTLSVDAGSVTVAGALAQKSGSAIKSNSSAIEPTTTGNGSITEAPTTVDALDFRFEYNIPTTAKEYIISGGGTAKWEPGSNGTANKLTLNGVTMTGTSYLVGVPANTEIILTGANKITATSGDAIKAQATGAVLKITGTGSLEVSAPAANNGYPLYGAAGVDVDIDGAFTVTGQIRGSEGPVSIKSGEAITVNGSIYASDSVTVEAGTSLSIVNSDGSGIYAGDCTAVTLTARNGGLKVQGNGNYAILGDSKATVSLSAAGNLNVSGNYSSNPYSIVGETLNLDGTVPADTTIYTDSNIVIPDDKVLTNYGTLQLYNKSSTVTVDGTLNNYGAIINSSGVTVTPTGNGTINEKVYLDFTDSTTPASGDGYSWNSTSKTLTLNGIKMDTPSIGSAIILPDGAKLVLNGTNTLNSKNGALIEAKGSLEISGSGSLNGTSGGGDVLNAQGDVTITDCTLNLTATNRDAHVINTNGNDLTINGVSDVTLTDTAEPSWGVRTGDGGNFTLDSNAKLTIETYVGILVGVSNGQNIATVKIYGTLDTSKCASLCANLLKVSLDMQGSSIVMKDGTRIWLYQTTDTLTGETDLKSFTGLLRVATGNEDAIDYYKVTKDSTLGLYAVNSEVSFTADDIEGKVFTGWTAEGITLENPNATSISFIMPSNDVKLTTNNCAHEGFTVIKYNNDNHWYDCTNCGKTDINKVIHSGGTADCMNKAVCTTCNQGYGEIDSNNHANKATEWSKDSTGHWHICDCGKLDFTAHTSSGAATATTAETCIVCGYEIAPATGYAAAPVFNPADTSFNGSINVTITSATDGATIYYTTNGSTPTTASTKYTGAITITSTTTIKAIAVKDGMADSQVSSATYTKQNTGGNGGGGYIPTPPNPPTPPTPVIPENPIVTDEDKEDYDDDVSSDAGAETDEETLEDEKADESDDTDTSDSNDEANNPATGEDVSSGTGIIGDEILIENDNNPETGIAISFTGVIVSAVAVAVARKRKKQ